MQRVVRVEDWIFYFCGSEFGAATVVSVHRARRRRRVCGIFLENFKENYYRNEEERKRQERRRGRRRRRQLSTGVFQPRKTENLVLIDEIESLSPTIALASNISRKEETPRLLALVRPRSALDVSRVASRRTAFRNGAFAALGNPNGVFTIRKSKSDTTDAYIVVSFTNATLVLSIGDTVEEVTDTGILATSSTLAVSVRDDDDGSLIQIHPSGVRHAAETTKASTNGERRVGRKSPRARVTEVKRSLP